MQSVLLDEPAPPLSGRPLDGVSFDLDDHRGEVVVVNAINPPAPAPTPSPEW